MEKEGKDCRPKTGSYRLAIIYYIEKAWGQMFQRSSRDSLFILWSVKKKLFENKSCLYVSINRVKNRIHGEKFTHQVDLTAIYQGWNMVVAVPCCGMPLLIKNRAFLNNCLKDWISKFSGSLERICAESVQKKKKTWGRGTTELQH